MTSVFDDDPFGPVKEDKKPASPEPREVKLFHGRSDVDSASTAQHHTLGIGHNQSSPGDHQHDGKSSRKLGFGRGLTLSGSTGGNVALQSLIDFLGNFIEFTDNTT